jgi:hypothetical protein
MYNDVNDDDSSNLTKAVIMAMISATFVTSLITFSCNAEAQTFGANNDNNHINPTLLTELFTNDKQSAVTVNIATTTDPSNAMIKVAPSLITTRSYTHSYIDNTGGLGATPGIVEAAIGSQETRGFHVTDATTSEGPAAKARLIGGDSLTDIKGSYSEVSRIINIPKDMPTSSSIPSSSNQTTTNIPSSSNQTTTNIPSSSNQTTTNIPSSSNQTTTNIPSSSNQTTDILTYQNSSYGITIQYPANWTKDERDYSPNDTVTNIVAFFSPDDNTSDIYPTSLAIYMDRLTNQNLTVEEYAASQIAYFNKTLTDFNLIESNTNITLKGRNNPAYGLIYTDRENGNNYKTMEIATISGDRIYYIKYIAEEKQYSNYLPAIQRMINSLQIT